MCVNKRHCLHFMSSGVTGFYHTLLCFDVCFYVNVCEKKEVTEIAHI